MPSMQDHLSAWAAEGRRQRCLTKMSAASRRHQDILGLALHSPRPGGAGGEAQPSEAAASRRRVATDRCRWPLAQSTSTIVVRESVRLKKFSAASISARDRKLRRASEEAG